ncbi:type IIA topoisomerase (DNA gyrase/topo II, topoisomerase IV), B subunit [Saprospira grandis DSM 2844]|uniref:DNA topoisomerase (ATP-hydrolyzing) n=1 Tax=Saprospira grandis DSM 2844 TaxID=694433 RepID=J1I5M0_9BACT|nr:DNA topoisomerase IV subunit B [Saprospira grandis]EJF53668.1 type IIA topoisomerase (DNA gyrase/topo II, topoisomerase IV), B subunit [Saprospira grandis DSM 2844]
MAKQVKYDEQAIRSLDWKEHIRMRPGMYIGKLGNGNSPDDGIYVLVKEVLDNSLDEFMMGAGKKIEVKVMGDGRVSIRDYGRGIPLGKVVDCVSKINTGGKYDSRVFQKSVGLNGVGTKAVNALSSYFKVQAFREGRTKIAEFATGELTKEWEEAREEPNGTYVEFVPDENIFKQYKFNLEYIEDRIWDYVYLNRGLNIYLNGQRYYSKNGLFDLLSNRVDVEKLRYPIVHLMGEDIEIAFSHGNNYGEQYVSFVNGQNTTQGGTHLNAFRTALVKTIRDFYGKSYDATDIRTAIVAAVSVRVMEPVFESQTKTKLGSTHVAPDGPSMNSFVADFLRHKLDNYLHKNPEVAKSLQKRIIQSERERKEIAGIRKLANSKAKKASLHNKKLRDCRAHYNSKHKRAQDSMIFITEGDSASGSITKSRDVQTQAVFSLRGKPLNCYRLTKKVVYQNDEFNLLQHALNIEDGLDELRYNKVIIATDADVDGMHIRLLLLTFFLQFFPELVSNGHLYILETPLFRVRNKKKTFYCYSEEEKQAAMKKLGRDVEVTRFKGLGEISPDEFKQFIGDDIRLEPVRLSASTDLEQLLSYYMGKNTPQRQRFIIDNLRLELDALAEN